MKKQKQTKETLLQYIYEFGVEKTCKMWGITEDQLEKVLNPVKDSNPRTKNINTNSVIIKAGVSEIISKNYSYMWSKYVKDKSSLSMCQTTEDIFHSTLLKVMEDLSEIEESKVLEYIDYKLKMINFQIKQNQKELYKHQTYLEDALFEKTSETEE